MTDFPVLETARLRLRPIGPADAEALHQVLADPRVMRWWSSPPHREPAETRDYLTYTPALDGMRSWAITRPPEDVAIGWVTVIAKRPGVAEIGYLLAPEHWGGGIAGEAVRRVIDHLFAVDGLRRIFADADPENWPSRKLLEALGFTREGVLREEWETHIGVRDTVLYGLLRREWPR